MMADIKSYVNDCIFCLQNSRQNRSEPMQHHKVPTRPWEILWSDLFELNGASYLLVMDQYSHFPVIRKMVKTTSAEVTSFIRNLFAMHGVCKTMYTDNGPQYASGEFKMFAKEWDFTHITSSPHYPKSNRFCERMVGVVKDILKKAQQSGTDPNLAILCYRATSSATDQA